MSTLLLHHGGSTRALPLAPSTLVGRAPVCHARIDDPAVPLYWLEVRWRGASWAWRTLAADDRTRAPGASREDEWRTFPAGRARPARVSLGDVVHVEIVDAGPPQPFLRDVVSGETVRGDALTERVELRDGALLPLNAEGDGARALREGQVFLEDGRAWQVFGVSSVAPTLRARIDLSRDGTSLAIDLEPLRATLLQGSAAVEIHGECVRALAAYHAAARDGAAWLDATSAWAAWRALGGNPESPAERIAWERGRARSAFARAGVAAVDRLFEVRRERDGVRVRLAVRAG